MLRDLSGKKTIWKSIGSQTVETENMQQQHMFPLWRRETNIITLFLYLSILYTQLRNIYIILTNTVSSLLMHDFHFKLSLVVEEELKYDP